MTNFTKKLTTAIATGALLAQTIAPIAAAQTTLIISENGAGSENEIESKQESQTTVTQNNDANVTNNVTTNANTGYNDANFNTGGNVAIDTGNAEVNAHVTNDLNRNFAEVENCNCANDTDVLVEGNGAFSENEVEVENKNEVEVEQDNDADVDNDVEANANTGKNSAGFNTGDGDVVIRTGNAKVNVGVETTANTNYARVGSHGDRGHVSLRILDNGAGSENEIEAELENETDVDQDNDADIDNDVETKANTGYNDANFNTGDGYVVIDTGRARVNAYIDNEVNFNAADVDCGCVYDLLAKIAGNGADVPHGYNSDAENKIKAELEHELEVEQDNDADLDNYYDGWKTNTGKNEASKNTAGSDSDPVVWTGDAESNVGIENSGNTNILGELDFPEFDMPEVDFDWNWHAMWTFFGMSNHS